MTDNGEDYLSNLVKEVAQGLDRSAVSGIEKRQDPNQHEINRGILTDVNQPFTKRRKNKICGIYRERSIAVTFH